MLSYNNKKGQSGNDNMAIYMKKTTLNTSGKE
jgi:hypothetical protein